MSLATHPSSVEVLRVTTTTICSADVHIHGDESNMTSIRLVAICAAASLAVSAHAQTSMSADEKAETFSRPSYQVLRFNEDWSFLRHKPAGAPSDLFDPVKYSPFNDSEDIWLSMERNMQCAVGHCGHCQFGPDFVCRDGPVFNMQEAVGW